MQVAAWIALAFIAGAVDPILVKWAYRDQMTVIQLLVIRNLMAAIMQGALVRRLPGKGSWDVLAAGLLLFTTQCLYILSLQSLPVVAVVTTWAACPAIVALINICLGREKLQLSFWIGFALCFVGILLTLDFRGVAVNPLGSLFLVIAVCSSACYRVYMETLTRKHTPASAAAWTFIIQGVLSLAFLPWLGSPKLSSFGYGAAMALAGAIGNVAFVSALGLVGSTRVSILNLLNAPLMVIIAALTLHEPLTTERILSLILVLTGVRFARVKRIEKANSEAASTPTESPDIETTTGAS